MRLRLILLFYLVLLIQTTVMGLAPWGGVRPDLILVTALVIAVAWGPTWGGGLGFLLGLILDLYTGYLVGIGGIARGLTALGAGYLAQKVIGQSWGLAMFLGFFGTLASELVTWVIRAGFGRPMSLDGIWPVLFWSAVYNALLTPVFMVIWARIINPVAGGEEI